MRLLILALALVFVFTASTMQMFRPASAQATGGSTDSKVGVMHAESGKKVTKVRAHKGGKKGKQVNPVTPTIREPM